MRITITFDHDVAELIERERARTGESLSSTVNRLLLQSTCRPHVSGSPALPELPGGPILGLSDVSALLAVAEDERRAQTASPTPTDTKKRAPRNGAL